MKNRQTSCVRASLLLLVATLAGCAVCKSTDNAEQCRTKERDHGQTRASIPGALLIADDTGYKVWRVSASPGMAAVLPQPKGNDLRN